MKHKVVTRCARRATRIAGYLSGPWKHAVHRSYRRRVRQMDHADESVNYEPPRGMRITAWDVC